MEAKRILWPTDFSKNAEGALPYFISLSEKCTGEWREATEHAIDELSNSLFSISEPRWSSEEDSKKLKTLKRRVHDLYGKYKVTAKGWEMAKEAMLYEGLPTLLDILRKASSIGNREGLRFIYIGNLPGESGDTICPQCQETLIRRHGFLIEESRMIDSTCPGCGKTVAGVFRI